MLRHNVADVIRKENKMVKTTQQQHILLTSKICSIACLQLVFKLPESWCKKLGVGDRYS